MPFSYHPERKSFHFWELEKLILGTNADSPDIAA